MAEGVGFEPTALASHWLKDQLLKLLGHSLHEVTQSILTQTVNCVNCGGGPSQKGRHW